MATDEARPLLDPSTANSLDYKSIGDIEQTEELVADEDEGPYHCHDSTSSEEENGSKKRATRTLFLSIIVCLAFMICEVVGGWLAQSLAIITDAAHLHVDLFVLNLSRIKAGFTTNELWMASKVLGAFLSVFLIWVITAILVYLAIQRIITGEYDINATVMAITAGIGVIVNIAMGALLYFGGHGHSHGGSHGHHAHHDEEEDRSHSHSRTEANINLRAAFIHVIGDLVQSIGVLIAALLIFFNNSWSIVDPICTLIFSVIVLFTTIYIVRDALFVLLEGRPSSIDFYTVFSSLAAIDGVLRVHNLRIWSLTTDKVALSVHLEIRSEHDARRILREASDMLRKRFGVHECTVQIEGYDDKDCGHCVPPKP